MPRPKNKADLLQACHKEYNSLMALIDGYRKETREAEFGKEGLNRNIRDVLAHLMHWHLMFMDWYKVGMAGKKPNMPASGYTWRDLPKLNQSIWEAHRQEDLGTVRKDLAETHRNLLSLIERHTDEELFTKKRYKWTGSTSLGAYIVSNSSSHYVWARQLIKKGHKDK